MWNLQRGTRRGGTNSKLPEPIKGEAAVLSCGRAPVKKIPQNISLNEAEAYFSASCNSPGLKWGFLKVGPSPPSALHVLLILNLRATLQHGGRETGPAEGASFPFKAPFRGDTYLFCFCAIDQAVLTAREFGRCVYVRRSNAQLKCGYSVTKGRGEMAGGGSCECLPHLPSEGLRKHPGSISHLEVYWGKRVYPERMSACWLPDPCSEKEFKFTQSCSVLCDCKHMCHDGNRLLHRWCY